MSYVSKNPRFDTTTLTDQGVGSPGNPAAGSHRIVDRAGVLYLRDSAGTETVVGSAAILPTSQQSIRGNNGYGSSNTEVLRFVTADVAVGTNITYADSATLGGSFTINRDGVYAVSMSVRSSGGSGGASLTLNTTSQGSGSGTLALASISSNLGNSLAWTGRLVVGDVIRGVGNFGTPDSSSGRICVAEVVPL